jgi:hypothetical protein
MMGTGQGELHALCVRIAFPPTCFMSPSNRQLTTALRIIIKMNALGFKLVSSHENQIKSTSECYYTLTFSKNQDYVCFCIDTAGYPEANKRDFDEI